MIKVRSFIQEKGSLTPVDVELTLWPGLPGIQFLGLADQHLKESSLRIKSAIKASGFQFPVSQQILVNLRPSHLKKTSRGLELAVAAAYLWESGQLRAPVASSDFYVYGELGLSGEVIEPEDLPPSDPEPHSIVLTGQGVQEQPAVFRRQKIDHLQELERPMEIPAAPQKSRFERPLSLVRKYFSQRQARLLEILAVGEHSMLMAGPPGSGKSTVAQSLPGFLSEISSADVSELQKIHRQFGSPLTWRPVVKPHHSTPVKAMIGGGSVPFAGEISRAHGGVLILDELLEFAGAVQEALREPFEEGLIRIYRNGVLKEYPARVQILATTNLCPCGKWTPHLGKEKPCTFSLYRCQSYGPRLSGPLVDRFDLVEFAERIGDLNVWGLDQLARIQEAQRFSKHRRQGGPVNSRTPIEEILRTLPVHWLEMAGYSGLQSQRRKSALVKVARTLADLDFQEQIGLVHLEEALQLSVRPFERLARWG
jgi:magnesium chelatase family protein